LKQLGITKSYDVDIVLEKLGIKPYDIDVLIKKMVEKGYDVDMLLKQLGITQSYDTDVVLTRLGMKPYDVDVVVKKIVERSYEIDVPFSKEESKQFLIDVILGEILYGQFGMVPRYKRRKHTPSRPYEVFLHANERFFPIKSSLFSGRIGDEIMKIKTGLSIRGKTDIVIKSDFAHHENGNLTFMITTLRIGESRITIPVKIALRINKRSQNILPVEISIKTMQDRIDKLRRLKKRLKIID
jgi:hypothetical protein